jgi:hypothetical protein
MICSENSPPRSLLEHDWRRSPVALALSRAFTPPPDIPIWQWADRAVFLQNEDAAEPGQYRSSKTPWTRRVQELIRNPHMWVWNWKTSSYVRVPVTEINVQKSSQSGFSEALLNAIRWAVTYRPRNCIYAIDSADEAKKIARRLLRSFRFLDRSIFTGDPDDIKTLEFQLRGMELLFYGSFSTGKFANKQAPLCFSDEVEEHGKFILSDMASRKKTSTGGLQVNLSKPKLTGGPINLAFLRGNQEEYFVPCPHCGQLQFLTFFPEEREVSVRDFRTTDDLLLMADGSYMPHPLPLGEKRKMRTGRFVFEHCKNLLGQWDRLRVQTETHYECPACQGAIREEHKRWMLDRSLWLPMEIANSPGIVSQHMSDFYSEDELSALGKMSDEYIDAKHESRDRLQAFYNHRCGKPWSEEANTTQASDILANLAGRSVWFVDAPNTDGQLSRNIFTDEASADRLAAGHAERGVVVPVIHSACPPYQRGTIPFPPFRASQGGRGGLILGSDVGGNYARWVVLALHQNLSDIAVIDWGEELDPDSIREIINHKTWPIRLTGEKCRAVSAWMDARWRPTDVYRACLASRGVIIPTKGLGGAASINIKLWSFNRVASYHERFRELHYNDQRAKDRLYIDRIKRMRSRLWFPIDVEEDPTFIEEMCAERQIQDRRGRWIWDDDNSSDNHYGDSVKEAILGIDFMVRQTKAKSGVPDPETAS